MSKLIEVWDTGVRAHIAIDPDEVSLVGVATVHGISVLMKDGRNYLVSGDRNAILKLINDARLP